MTAWDACKFLEKLLGRDFKTVETCGNQLDFATVEKSWPCPAASAARERFEGMRVGSTSDRLYIAKRQREGVSYPDALSEFKELDPPPPAV